MINPRLVSLSQSSTLRITALTKKLKSEGKDIVNFAAGEPDFDTPLFVKEAAKRAIDEGFTKYTPSPGTLELREKIAEKLVRENNIPCKGKNIIVTPGAKYAVFTAIFSLLKEDEEVIIPSPYWLSYPEMVILSGGKVKVVPADGRDNFKLKIENLKKAITAKSKILILNYPNNPTGITYNEEELREIYEAVKDKGIFVISDEIYEKLIYDGRKHISFASFPGADRFTITINGFSKTYSMTGWRIGYLAAPEEVVNEASKMIDHTTSCTSSISQRAAEAALENKDWPETIKKDFQERRNLLWDGLAECEKIIPVKSQGTFYMFCDIRNTGLSSLEFCSQLLEKYLVSSIPANAFGAEGFIRLSFATSSPSIEKGVDRIKTFLKRL